MIKHQIKSKTLISRNESYEGETIEMKVNRIMVNNEPISDSTDLIYTDRKDGVLPDYDIRSDRMEYALEGLDKFSKAKMAQRAEFYKKPDDGKAESIQATGEK